MAAGRVEQVTAIHRVNIMEFRTGLFNGDRYRQVTVIQSGRYSRFDCIYIVTSRHTLTCNIEKYK